MMKKYFLFIVLLPFVGIAQKSKTAVKAKNTLVKQDVVQVMPAKPADGFLIIGNIKGYPDGTTVALHNGNTGAQELTTQIQNNRFTLTGNVSFPDFKLIVFNNKPPYITLFLDNSLVNINGKADSLDNALITGSPSQNEFAELNNIVKP
jgi:hypothetical protein